MKKLILSAALCLSLSTFASLKSFLEAQMKNGPISPKYGGAMDGGGSGTSFPGAGSAWFYQDNPKGFIDACIIRAASFKATEAQIETAILKAYQIWQAYIDKHNIYEDKVRSDGSVEPYPTHMKILTNVKINPCSKNTDLRFYMGTIDNKVKGIKERFVNPKAFAFRNYKDIDIEKGLSKGLVWLFNPQDPTQTDHITDQLYDWSDKDVLLGMLLHEIGHTLGVPHVNSTIMGTKLKNKIFVVNSTHSPDYAKLARKYLNNIDHESYLIKQFQGLMTKEGTLGVQGSSDEKSVFKELIGRDLVGKSKVKVLENGMSWEVHIHDDIGGKKFHLKWGKVNSVSMSLWNEYIFKRFRKIVETNADGDVSSYYIDEDSHWNFSGVLNFEVMGLGKKILMDYIFNAGVSNIFDENGKQYYMSHPVSLYFTNSKGARKPLYIVDPKLLDFEDDDPTVKGHHQHSKFCSSL